MRKREILPAAFMLLAMVLGTKAVPKTTCNLGLVGNQNIYQFKTKNVYENETIDLNAYKGKMPMFNALKTKYGSKGFEILGFPANNFELQQPGSKEKIMLLYKYISPGKGYVPNYKMAQKVDVNGDKQSDLYKFLKSVCPSTREKFAEVQHLFYTPLYNSDIRWNFEKFLIDKKGRPRYRCDPTTIPPLFYSQVEALLAE